MPSLSETQTRFARAVLDAGRAVPPGVTSHVRPRPERRFGVYRNNVYASLISVLQGRFPAVARLLGEEFFRAAARLYVERHPPASPVLMRYGGSFASFLDRFEPVADLPWIGDVARLEWTWNTAYHAADAAPMSHDELTAFATEPETADRLVFDIHPSLSLVTSRYPVVTIWSANTSGTEPGPIDAGAGGEDALIVRPRLSVEVRRLPPGGAAFIAALAQQLPLGKAAAEGASAARDFDLQRNLTGLFRSGAVVALRAAGTRNNSIGETPCRV